MSAGPRRWWHAATAAFARVRLSALAGSAQALGLVQVLLVVHLALEPRDSDAYLYLLIWVQVPTQMVVVGVLNPTWLRIGASPEPRRLTQLARALPFAVLIAGPLGMLAYAALSGQPFSAVSLYAALGAVLAPLFALTWTAATRLAVDGFGAWLAGVTLIPNALGVAGLGAVWWIGSGIDPVVVLLVTQIIGYATVLALLIRTGSAVGAAYMLRDGGRTPGGGARKAGVHYFAGQAAVSYGAGLVLQSATAALPAASLSILGIITRAVSGIQSLITNANLPSLVHTSSVDDRAPLRFLDRFLAVAGSAGAAAVVVSWYLRPAWTLYVAAVVGWILAAALNATVKRIAVRFHSPRLTLITTATSISVTLALTGMLMTGHLTFTMVLFAYLLLDLVSGVWTAVRIRRLRVAALYLGACVVFAAVMVAA